jgi:hypothetical protein
MSVRDPRDSNVYPWSLGGKPLSREDALADEKIGEFWNVADFVAEKDSTLNSYLNGARVDLGPRVLKLVEASKK